MVLTWYRVHTVVLNDPKINAHIEGTKNEYKDTTTFLVTVAA
jgi:hypothetical protein